MERPLVGKVLVLGNGSRAFLGVIRSLGRAGLTVEVGMCPEDDLALKSRYVSRRHDVPLYHPGTTLWLDRMHEILASKQFDLVIPCHDPSLIPLQLHKKELGHLCRLYTLGDHAYQISFDKIASNNLAISQGIPVARSSVVTGLDAPSVVLSSFKLPVVLKPLSSFVSTDLQKKRAVRRARCAADLIAYFKPLTNDEPTLVQENFLGTGVGVELLAKDGKILVAFQHQRVHEPLEGGGSSYRKSVPLHHELLSAAKKLMEAIHYTGVAMVEFKMNFGTGEWIFIEINGRFWGSLPLAIASGVDFPRYLYEMLIEGRTDFPQEYRTPIYCRNLSIDVRWMRGNLRADKKDLTLATRPLHKVVGELANFVLLRERSDTFVLDDPLPGVVEFERIFREYASGGWRRIALRFHDSFVGRKLARRDICRRLRQVEEILFVCKGNICRSPFAQRYAEKICPKAITFSSCGYFPVANRPAPEAAQTAADTVGVNLGDHRSVLITEELARHVSIIFVFDVHNRDQMISRFPSLRNRIFFLGSLLDDGPVLIADPYSSDNATFLLTYRRIAKAIDALADLLPPAAPKKFTPLVPGGQH